MSQLSYSIDTAKAFKGLIADSTRGRDVYTVRAEVELPFGLMVVKGTADEDGKLPTAAGDITAKLLRGVAVASQSQETPLGGASLPSYKANDAAGALRKGRIWVESEDAVTAGTSGVHVRHSNGQSGAFRATTVSGETVEVSELSAKWKSSTTGTNELALLELDV